MNSAIERYVSLVVVAALGAAFVLFVTDPAFNADFARAALTFGVISVLAQLLSYRTGGSSTGSVSFIPVLASAAIAPNCAPPPRQILLCWSSPAASCVKR